MPAVLLVCLLAMSCSHPVPRSPTLQGMRCTVRVTNEGIFVDGEPRSRAEAVAYCKRTTEGAILVIGERAPLAQVEQLRSALQRERIRICPTGRPTDETRFVRASRPVASPAELEHVKEPQPTAVRAMEPAKMEPLPTK